MTLLPVLACRPVDPDEYPPARRKAWETAVAALVAKGAHAPEIYPRSIYEPCGVCEVMVAVGPQQQKFLDSAEIVCVLCAVDMGSHSNPLLTSVREELDVDSIVEQIDTELHAEMLREMGVNAQVAQVYVDPAEDGFPLECAVCKRIGMSTTQPPEGYTAVCPDCAGLHRS